MGWPVRPKPNFLGRSGSYQHPQASLKRFWKFAIFMFRKWSFLLAHCVKVSKCILNCQITKIYKFNLHFMFYKSQVPLFVHFCIYFYTYVINLVNLEANFFSYSSIFFIPLDCFRGLLFLPFSIYLLLLPFFCLAYLRLANFM